ncbi:unnamed protein product [Aphanomyces euteiches]
MQDVDALLLSAVKLGGKMISNIDGFTEVGKSEAHSAGTFPKLNVSLFEHMREPVAICNDWQTSTILYMPRDNEYDSSQLVGEIGIGIAGGEANVDIAATRKLEKRLDALTPIGNPVASSHSQGGSVFVKFNAAETHTDDDTIFNKSEERAGNKTSNQFETYTPKLVHDVEGGNASDALIKAVIETSQIER